MKRISLSVLVVALSGCFVPSTGDLVGRAMDRTIDSAAERVGDQIGQAIAANMLASNPQLMFAYSMSVFSMMFHHGGYWFQGFDSYEAGSFSRWEVTGATEGSRFERALLRRNQDTSEWWRVETYTPTDQGEDVVIMEALLSSADEAGARRVLRMRAMLPGDAEAREIPVEEKDSEQWKIHQGRTLTKESMEGMTKGTEAVTTPAGSFKATHLQSTDGVNTVNWYVVDAVPGKLVKYNAVAEDGKNTYEWVLTAYGQDQTASKLSSF
jgi:hypothetical protein